jgi:hypothetical protein
MTADGISLMHDLLKSNILKAQVQISGNFSDFEITRTEKTTDSIKFFIYLDETVTGTIQKYRLITTAGKTFDERVENFTKDSSRGYLILFEYKIKEV